MSEPVVEWDVERVRQWLQDNGFSSYAPLLCDKHRLDGNCLLMLTEQDLKQPPLEIKVRRVELWGEGGRESGYWVVREKRE